MPTKPSSQPTWATNASTTFEPSGAQKAAGFGFSKLLPARWLNWVLNLVYQWIAFVDSPAGNGYTPAFTITAGTGVDGATGLLGYIADAHGIGLVGSAAVSANTDTARSAFKNSGVLGVADSGAAALTAFAESGGYGLIVKGQGAPMSDLAAMLGAHPDAASFVAGGTGSGAYFFCNGAQPALVVNNNGGPAVSANSLASGDGAQFNNSGSGAGIHGASLTGAGVWGSSLGAGVGVLGTMSSGANVTAALAGFTNTGVLAAADTGATALSVYCTTGALAVVIKGSEAAMADVTTMLTNQVAAFYLTQKIVPAMYLESNATGGVLNVENTGASGGGIAVVINNGPGVGVLSQSVSGEGVKGTSLADAGVSGDTSSGTGPGIRAKGNSTRAAVSLVPQSSTPSAGSQGDIYYDSTIDALKVHGASLWHVAKTLTSASSAASAGLVTTGVPQPFSTGDIAIPANILVPGAQLRVRGSVSGGDGSHQFGVAISLGATACSLTMPGLSGTQTFDACVTVLTATTYAYSIVGWSGSGVMAESHGVITGATLSFADAVVEGFSISGSPTITLGIYHTTLTI